jgi:hypothetical protein
MLLVEVITFAAAIEAYNRYIDRVTVILGRESSA